MPQAFPAVSRRKHSSHRRTVASLLAHSKKKEQPGVHSGMLQRRPIDPAMERVIQEVQG
jgi:hypothetical protein